VGKPVTKRIKSVVSADKRIKKAKGPRGVSQVASHSDVTIILPKKRTSTVQDGPLKKNIGIHPSQLYYAA